MPVGVPEGEVFAAADAVLARGERPTVERVRAELGRGSPARVGKVLEAWWEALAKRLAGETRLPALPTDVAQAFGAVWASACQAAADAAQAGVAQEREAISQERDRLASEQRAAREAIAAARTEAETAQREVAALHARLADQDARIAEQGSQLHELRLEHAASRDREAALKNERDIARAQFAEADAGWKAERERLATHLRATEDRAHAEVDRAREEAKLLQKQLAELKQTSASAVEAWRQKYEQAQTGYHLTQQQSAGLAAKVHTLEAQLARMDGLPAALLAAQKALVDCGRRVDALQRRGAPAPKARARTGSARPQKPSARSD